MHKNGPGALPAGKRRRPPTPTSPSASANEELLTAFEKMLDARVEQVAKRLDTIESSFGKKFKEIERRFDEVTLALDFQNKTVEELRLNEIPTIKNDIVKERTDMHKELDRLATYVCRENSIILGLPELMEEDTEKVVREFYRTNLQLGEEAEHIIHQRIHRVPGSMQKPRPIKIRFLRYSDKMKVHNHAKHLKGTSYVVTDDLPKRVREERRRQVPDLKRARDNGKWAAFSRSEPWKLIVVDKRSDIHGRQQGERKERQVHSAGL